MPFPGRKLAPRGRTAARAVVSAPTAPAPTAGAPSPVARAAVARIAACLWGASLAACGSTPDDHAIATMQDAVAAYRAGDLVRAEETALRAHRERPGFVDPLYLAARVREKGERWEDAREAYRTILAEDPTATPAAVALAQTFVAEHRTAEAEDWLRRALEEDPGAEAAAFNLGSLCEARGSLDEAAGWFGLSAALDARDPRSPTRIARIRLAQGRRDEAGRAAAEAVRRAPDYAPARQVLDAAR